MDNEQCLNSLVAKDENQQDRAWTTDEIRKNSSNWSLAGDVGLLNLLNEFSHHVISRTHEVENAVDSLVHETKMASAKINNIINDFHMLSNMQFVENRVYDEEVQEQVPEEKHATEKTKEQKEAEMLPKITRAIELGLTVLDKYFDKINVNEISDSEDEEDISSEGRTILEPKDPYDHRPLPFIIGSEEFQSSDFAGLQDLLEDAIESSAEEASSLSESEETSSEEEEPLPVDKFSGMPIERRSFQSISDKISSSEESELFGSEKEENGLASDSSFESKTKAGKNIQRTDSKIETEQQEVRQNSVSSLQSKLNLPQVLPVPKLQGNKKGDDLFTNEDDISDDESPFHKKTGLFTSDVKFDDDKDLFSSGLFDDSVKVDKQIKNTEKKKSFEEKRTPLVDNKNVKKPALFENEDDSEDDIFNTLVRAKKPVPKESSAGSQESSEKADSSSTPSSAPSTKPSGNTFDFVSGGDSVLFGDESDADDLFSSKKPQKRFDFDSAEDDDLFGIVSSKSFKKPEAANKASEKKISLFEDSDNFSSEPAKKEPEAKQLLKPPKKAHNLLFGDSDSSDQEIQIPVKTPQPVISEQKKQEVIPEKKKQEVMPEKKKQEINLFDDDDADDDIFSQASKKETAAKLESIFATKKPGVSLFDQSPQKEVVKRDEPVKIEKQAEKPSLFDDDSFEQEPIKSMPSTFDKKSKPLSLFEDSDNFDLFAPKSSTKETKSESPGKVLSPLKRDTPAKSTEEQNLFSDKLPSPLKKDTLLKASEEQDLFSKKEISSSKPVASEDIQSGFDLPVEGTKTLNVISKDRAKITAKRRKPTRKGRLAALENSDKENTSSVLSSSPESNVVGTKADSIFPTAVTKEKSAEPPATNYKTQEKQKMNLMSQLISEVALSKVRKKSVVEDNENDDDIDIFSEIVNKDKIKKQSFSFKSPEENSIDSLFTQEKEEKKKESTLATSDDADEFFSEPSFKNFRSSISLKDPVLDLNLDDDEEGDDDLFSTIKSSILPKSKAEASEPDIFDDDSDIFADIQKEKYEMFPSQLYDDEDDDDIFGNMDQLSDKTKNVPTKPSSNSTAKKVEKKQVDAFEDPLTGLLGED